MNKPAAENYTSRVKKHTIRYISWSIAWAATLILADKAALYGWHSSDRLSLLLIIVNAGVGFAMLATYMQTLKVMDELQRKIQLIALALALGVGLVGGVSYSLLVTTKFISDAEVTDLLLLMIFTYVAGSIIGQVRYR